jgi:acyl-coenzyme A synthetase/AMP-(fatty) acid ligase
VIGLPDNEWGERVVAVVVSATDDPPPSAALQEWVRARLRSTRVPAEIHLAPALPATETGKILRRALRESLTRSQ